jgi:hypothetical protein
MALQNFTEKCNDDILISYLDEIVKKLAQLLRVPFFLYQSVISFGLWLKFTV